MRERVRAARGYGGPRPHLVVERPFVSGLIAPTINRAPLFDALCRFSANFSNQQVAIAHAVKMARRPHSIE